MRIEFLKDDLEQQELVEDFVQIITIFSCKLQGKRANKARKLVNEFIEDGEENIDKNNLGNVTAKYGYTGKNRGICNI